jgi:hypothetical protein
VFNINNRHITPGKHGFDNSEPDMYATFYAWGSAFKSHKKINGFENVNVYPLIAQILSLNIDENTIDGKLKILQETLKRN